MQFRNQLVSFLIFNTRFYVHWYYRSRDTFSQMNFDLINIPEITSQIFRDSKAKNFRNNIGVEYALSHFSQKIVFRSKFLCVETCNTGHVLILRNDIHTLLCFFDFRKCVFLLSLHSETFAFCIGTIFAICPTFLPSFLISNCGHWLDYLEH